MVLIVSIACKTAKSFKFDVKRTMSALFLSLWSLTSSCVSTPAEYGIQDQAVAFIPARIAVLPCKIWPRGLNYRGLPLSNTGDEKMQELCTKTDAFIIDGFAGQPYMRGISPNVVAQLLAKNEKSDLLDTMSQTLLSDDGCSDCNSPITYYKKAITDQNDWRIWLNSFSRAVANSDAVLLPFVIFSYEGRINDRGIETSYRQAGLLVFLIDTNSGKLVWAGGRQAEIKHQGEPYDSKKPDIPSWQALEQRLFVSDIWQDFPGRQNY
jgi:hypothetical protein